MAKFNAKRIIIPAATFVAAMSLGFVVQNGDALASRLNPAREAEGSTAPKIAVQDMPAGVAALAANAEALGYVPTPEAPAEFNAPGEIILALADAGLGTNLQTATDADHALSDCTVLLDAQTGPMATAILTIDASCGGEGLIHHQGMIFSFATNADGHANLAVPALAEKAVFIVEMADGASALATADVPDLADYDRAVLQWQGKPEIHLHASEFGAEDTDAGHVWAGAPGSIEAVEAGTGGQLMVLGANVQISPFVAEIYTYPKGDSRRAGEIALTTEIAVDQGTCGRDISAQSIQIGADGALHAVDLTMTVPGCDAVGSYLIVPAMFVPYQVASAG